MVTPEYKPINPHVIRGRDHIVVPTQVYIIPDISIFPDRNDDKQEPTSYEDYIER